MNVAIAAVVGAVLATVALIGGVNAAQGDQKPVAQSELYQYSSE